MMRALAFALATGCTGAAGTLQVELATAPDSPLLAGIERLRLTLTSPATAFEAVRGPDGLDLAFEVEPTEAPGIVIVEGFDGSGGIVAVGQSPPFSLAGTDAGIVIYVAPPLSIREAPAHLLPARTAIGATELVYGAAFVGGTEAGGAPSTTMAIYNAYDHGISYGLALPVPRANPVVAANDTAGVYVLGGSDENAQPTSNLYRFQTNVAPAGSYTDLGTHAGLEVTGDRAIELASDTFFVTGPQPAMLVAGELTARADLGAIPRTATRATTVDGTAVAACLRDASVVVVGATGTPAQTIALPMALPGADIAARPEAGTAVVVGGPTRDAYVVAFASGTAVAHADALSTVRREPTVAATARYIVVAGGLDELGAPIASADILDATSLARVATVPIVARGHTTAVVLPNEQIAFVGGDTPTELVELFTPPAEVP